MEYLFRRYIGDRFWVYVFVLISLLVLSFCLLGVLSYLAEMSRDCFGKRLGNMLNFSVLLMVIAGGVSYLLIKSGQVRIGISLSLLGFSAVFCFFSWFFHPNQVYSRAEDRLSDWQETIDEYSLRPENKSRVVYRRLYAELSARKLEAGAMILRDKGDSEFFQDVLFPYILAAISIILFAYAGILVISRNWHKVDEIKYSFKH